jgi:hypothetical protein
MGRPTLPQTWIATCTTQDSQNRPGQQIDFQGLVMIDARDKARQLEAEASDAGPVPAQTQRFLALRADEGLSPQPALVA